MKYLNKVIFINSADGSLPYAEVILDGNVHFTGTQGVGKSTLLRAFLFFYNANKQKLGIPQEKKRYDDYYFPFQNSYIVYEIQSDTGAFCVLTFKRQGRVAFRFFDAAYHQKYFIDKHNKAFASWANTREVLGRNIDYTRIISSYEEYRNILYGNNKGLPAEFRKYALLNSKQYQNIPRTISNVFLNAKLDAQFVKETIIKSLNEEEIKIDLTRFSHHLKDFKTHLADIKKWTQTNHRKENQVENQAKKLIETYRALNFIARNKIDLANQLGFALHQIEEQNPLVEEQLKTEENNRQKIKLRLNLQEEKFEKKKEKIQEEIGGYSSKLKEIRDKKKQYKALEISKIIARVEKKQDLEIEQKNLTKEKVVLTSEFSNIQQRFQAQYDRLTNQFEEFKNRKTTGKNKQIQAFYTFKDRLNEKFEKLLKNIEKQHKEERRQADSQVIFIGNSLHKKQLEQSEIKHKTYFKKEIQSTQDKIDSLKYVLQRTATVIKQAKETRKNLEREWELEKTGIEAEQERKGQKENEKIHQFENKIEQIAIKIKTSQDSLYGWLNKNIPNWDQTIGKVIDEENVLFQSNLNPTKVKPSDSFFGIKIDTDRIPKNVKTIADLKEDRNHLDQQIGSTRKTIRKLQKETEQNLKNLKNRFRSKIKTQGKILETNRYQQEQNRQKSESVNVDLSDWHKKAKAEKYKDLQKIKTTINRLNEEKIEAEKEIEKVKKRIRRKINTQKRKQRTALHTEQEKLTKSLGKIDAEIQIKKSEIDKEHQSIKAQHQQKLKEKGADTKRIDEIDLKLKNIENELVYIENNRDKVVEYHKDKRELFDREEDFKTQRKSLESSLETGVRQFKRDKEKWLEKLMSDQTAIKRLEKQIQDFKNNLKDFEEFKNSDLYESLVDHLNFSKNDETDKSCSAIIRDLHTQDNTYNKRYIKLQEQTNKFTGHFEENNIFKFKVKITTAEDYFAFAENLEEFIEEEKIKEFKKRVESRFAEIIRRIGTETNELRTKEGEISKVIRDINNDFKTRNFVGAIKRMELKIDESAHKIYQLLLEITKFNEDHAFNIGTPDLFSIEGQGHENEKAVRLLHQLVKEVDNSRSKEITLSDSFELLFRVVENDNDTGWVEKLSNVGSEGTDVLAKAMINIMLLNVFKERATKKKKNDFSLHCMMDEVGKLHPTNVKGILQFANDRNILLINSSPVSQNATDYRYTYHLSKNKNNLTTVKKLIRVN